MPGMRGISEHSRRWTLEETWRAKHLAFRELLAREVDFDSRRESVPHVRHDPLAVEEHVRRDEFTADEIVHDETGHIAMALSGVVLRPAVVRVDCVGPPTLSNRIFELS